MSDERPCTTSRFYVKFGGETQGVFTEASGLQVELDMTEYREGGNNSFTYRFPGPARFSNLSLKRGIVRKNDFYTWFKEIIDGNFKPKNVSLIMYDEAGKEVLTWDFTNAYPVKWIGPEFQVSPAELAIETLELAYEGMTLQ